MSKVKLSLAAVAFVLAIGAATTTRVNANNTKFFDCASAAQSQANMDFPFDDCVLNGEGEFCCYVPESSEQYKREE